LQFVVTLRFDETLPAFDGEHDVGVDLRVRVGRGGIMPLLTELVNVFVCAVLQRCRP
jgi:hypothetical protein